jgi:hypothetical protein
VRTSSNGVKDSARDLRTFKMIQKWAAVYHPNSCRSSWTGGHRLSNAPKLDGNTIHQILVRGRSARNLLQSPTYELTEHCEWWLNSTFKFWKRYWRGFRQWGSYVCRWKGNLVVFARQCAWPSAMTLKHFLAICSVVEISHTPHSPDLVPDEVLYSLKWTSPSKKKI